MPGVGSPRPPSEDGHFSASALAALRQDRTLASIQEADIRSLRLKVSPTLARPRAVDGADVPQWAWIQHIALLHLSLRPGHRRLSPLFCPLEHGPQPPDDGSL